MSLKQSVFKAEHLNRFKTNNRYLIRKFIVKNQNILMIVIAQNQIQKSCRTEIEKTLPREVKNQNYQKNV